MITNKDNLPFGKRYGYEAVNIPFQIDDIDKVLRTELWNAFYLFIYSPLKNADQYSEDSYKILHRIIWIHYFKRAFDDFPNYSSDIRDYTREYIENAVWYKVYEFFEFVFRNIKTEQKYSYQDLLEYIISKLKSNNAGYTIINDTFIPIINEAEINEIKHTQIITHKYGLNNIQEHLNASIELLSKKPIPDYRNSIKESISMVEVISRIIEPTENTLGKALNKLEKNKKLNVNLKAGFEKLYNYTNGKNGIRHALMEEKNNEPEDAKFFLIACSAFTNYLIEKAKKENLLTER